MFFSLSKLFWFVASPSNFFVVLSVVVLCASFFARTRKLARVLGSIGVAAALVIWLSPLPKWIVTPLETRFPAPIDLPAEVDGIIVLGGAVLPGSTAFHEKPQVNGAAERYLETAVLARRYPTAWVVHAGHSGNPFDQVSSEAEAAVLVFDRVGVPAERILYEAQSRNTYENAQFTARLLGDEATTGTWLLVTSALHMPRAMGSFRAAGMDPIAYPVDYQAVGSGKSAWPTFFIRLRLMDLSVKEWLGLVVYSLTNRIDSLFPAP